MTHCTDVERLAARYVDGEATAAERGEVERHARRCPECHESLAAERAVRRVLRANAAALASADTAPPALTARLTALAAGRPAGARAWSTPARLVRAAVAASLVLAGGLWLTSVVTRQSTTVLAAQLTADHVKCFLTNHDRGVLDPQHVAADLRARYGFDARVPASRADLGLRLVGARRCLSGEGTNAHILYTWQGQSVSLYMLPGSGPARQARSVLGHTSEMWSGHNGTYVLVTPATGDARAPLVGYMRRATD